jgi:vacuolar-type H+-ATPase subunit E/Vma4
MCFGAVANDLQGDKPMPNPKSQLTVAREEFMQYVHKSLEVALALRDELKAQAQQGTEGAKAQWADLEARLAHLDKLPHNLSQAAGELVDRLLKIGRSAAPKRVKRRVKRVAKASAKRRAPSKPRAPSKRPAPKKKTRR